MEFWSLDEIKSASGGRWLARADASSSATPLITGVSIDTRTLTQGQIFIAIKGEQSDGHEYLDRALAAGASMLIVHEPLTPERIAALPRQVPILKVANTGAALHRLAAAYRKTLDGTRVIAVAGSNGKTTTTRLIDACLRQTQRGSASQKSFNNALGVPLTILAAKRTDQYLICEVGTNAPGEIAPLTLAIEPDIAVITSIGREHLEGLGSLRGVIEEEASIIAGLRPGGCAIITADEPLLKEAARPSAFGHASSGDDRVIVITFGVSDSADMRVSSVTMDMKSLTFSINDRHQFNLPLLGTHNAINAACAAAVARRLGLDWPQIQAGFDSVKPAPMRLEPIEIASPQGQPSVWFLNDAYNANPESMLAALSTFAQATHVANSSTSRRRRVIILGDMLELGPAAPDSHAEIARWIVTQARSNPARTSLPATSNMLPFADTIILVGSHMLRAHAVLQANATLLAAEIFHIPTLNQGGDTLAAALLRPGDAVLLKGSRGTGVDRVLTAWCARSDSVNQPQLANQPISPNVLVVGTITGTGLRPEPTTHATHSHPHRATRGPRS